MLEYHIYDVTIWIKGDNCKANVRQWDWHLDNQPSFYWPWKRVISNPSANPTIVKRNSLNSFSLKNQVNGD